MAAQLREAEADVIGVQEASPAQSAYLAQEMPDFDMFTHTARVPEPLLGQLRARYGSALGDEIGELALFVKRGTIDVEAFRHWWLSPTPDVELSTGYGKEVPRSALSVSAVHRSSGMTLTFATTHVDRTAPFEQTEVCRSQLQADVDAGRSTFLFGDLNSDVDGRGIESLRAAGWRDVAVDGPTWLGDDNNRPARIDHVLVNSDAIRDARALVLELPSLLSDHRPVLATFAIDA